MVAEALIQANFNLSIKNMQYSEVAEWQAKAIWLEKWRLNNTAEMQDALWQKHQIELLKLQNKM